MLSYNKMQSSALKYIFESLDVLTERGILMRLASYIANHGAHSLIDRQQAMQYNIICNNTDSRGVSFPSTDQGSLLHFAVMKGYTQLICYLLENGFNVNQQVQADPNSISSGFTPLLLASMMNKSEIVALLLNKNANVMSQTSLGMSVLMLTTSEECCQLIIDSAKTQRLLYPLIKLKNHNNIGCYEYACDQQRLPILKRLLTIMNYWAFIDANAFLNFARKASFQNPLYFNEYDTICDTIRNTVKKERSIPPNVFSVNNLSSVYFTLFNKSPPQSVDNKQDAIEYSVAQIASLLGTPERCKPYIKQISNDLANYQHQTNGKSIGIIDRKTVSWMTIDGVEYPIPRNNYSAVKNEHALQEYLTLLFQSHGLPHIANKWIGFIPHEKANMMASRGDFSVECRFGSGLFHTKVGHALQRAIFLLAIEKGEIDITYNEKGITKKLDITDILSFIVHNHVVNVPNASLWQRVFDSYHRDQISFRDPFRLGSFLMKTPEWGRSLSDYLVNTFAKGYNRLVAAHNEKNELKLTHLEYADRMNDLQMWLFDPPHYLMQHALMRERSKNSIIDENPGYSIVQKHYRPNGNFKRPSS